MTTRTWGVGDRVVLHLGPPLEPGGAGTVVEILPIAPHPVCVRWDVPQREPLGIVPGAERAATLHWHDELAPLECAEAIERGVVAGG